MFRSEDRCRTRSHSHKHHRTRGFLPPSFSRLTFPHFPPQYPNSEPVCLSAGRRLVAVILKHRRQVALPFPVAVSVRTPLPARGAGQPGQLQPSPAGRPGPARRGRRGRAGPAAAAPPLGAGGLQPKPAPLSPAHREKPLEGLCDPVKFSERIKTSKQLGGAQAHCLPRRGKLGARRGQGRADPGALAERTPAVPGGDAVPRTINDATLRGGSPRRRGTPGSDTHPGPRGTRYLRGGAALRRPLIPASLGMVAGSKPPPKPPHSQSLSARRGPVADAIWLPAALTAPVGASSAASAAAPRPIPRGAREKRGRLRGVPKGARRRSGEQLRATLSCLRASLRKPRHHAHTAPCASICRQRRGRVRSATPAPPAST